MSRRRPPRWAVAALPLLAWLAVSAPIAADPPPASPATDLRSLERLYYGCKSELGRRDVTLFGNGTVRLRDGLYEDPRMDLVELEPEELERYLARLAAEDPTAGVGDVARLDQLEGSFLEHCELRLELPGETPERHRFGRHEVLSLELTRLIRIAETLASRARPDRGPSLPAGYYPAVGDVLRNARDERYRVLWITEDGIGVELEGLDQPIRMLVSVLGLREVFVAVERAKDRRRERR